MEVALALLQQAEGLRELTTEERQAASGAWRLWSTRSSGGAPPETRELHGTAEVYREVVARLDELVPGDLPRD
jgi:hypothetical protein